MLAVCVRVCVHHRLCLRHTDFHKLKLEQSTFVAQCACGGSNQPQFSFAKFDFSHSPNLSHLKQRSRKTIGWWPQRIVPQPSHDWIERQVASNSARCANCYYYIHGNISICPICFKWIRNRTCFMFSIHFPFGSRCTRWISHFVRHLAHELPADVDVDGWIHTAIAIRCVCVCADDKAI